MIVTREELKGERERATIACAYPRAVAAEYGSRLGKVIVQLSNGHRLLLDPKRTQGLERASANELSRSRFSRSRPRTSLSKARCTPLGSGIVEGCLGSRKSATSQLRKAGGSVKTRTKSAAARKNGKLAGGPKRFEYWHASAMPGGGVMMDLARCCRGQSSGCPIFIGAHDRDASHLFARTARRCSPARRLGCECSGRGAGHCRPRRQARGPSTFALKEGDLQRRCFLLWRLSEWVPGSRLRRAPGIGVWFATGGLMATTKWSPSFT